MTTDERLDIPAADAELRRIAELIHKLDKQYYELLEIVPAEIVARNEALIRGHLNDR